MAYDYATKARLAAMQRAQELHEYKQNRLVARLAPQDVQCPAQPNITAWQWWQLHGYRHKTTQAETTAALGQAVGAWLQMASSVTGCCTLLHKDAAAALQMLYGTAQGSIEAAFHSALPECVLAEVDRLPQAEYPHHGMLLGSVAASAQLSQAFAQANIANAYLACVVYPLPAAQLQQMIARDLAEQEALRPYATVMYPSAEAGRQISLPMMTQADAELTQEVNFLRRNAAGGVLRIVLKYGAATAQSFDAVQHLVRSYCSTNATAPEDIIEPIQQMQLPPCAASWAAHLAVPQVMVQGTQGLEALQLLSMQPLASVVALCSPPTQSVKGCFIKQYQLDENALSAFPATAPVAQAAQAISLGQNLALGQAVCLPLQSLLSHGLIAGATMTGKTNTAKQMLCALDAQHIPFLVLEGAKKEYASLLQNIEALQVYGAGTDGKQFQCNALAPEEGVLIENHVAGIVQAIVAATQAEHPLPEALDGLLKQTYARAHWRYGTLAYHDETRPFPTFRQVYANIDSYVDKKARYGPEVRQNIRAALKIRIEALCTGAAGPMLSAPQGISAKELLAAPSVIEMAELSQSTSSFLVSILLFKIHSYLARQPACDTLKNLIFIEESHNLFRTTGAEDTTRAKNNEWLDKMLAEVRVSGCGIVLCEQQPSLLPDGAFANTAVKICHALVHQPDCNKMAAAMNLTPFQTKKLAELQKGEVVLTLREQYGATLLQVPKRQEPSSQNVACLTCNCRFRCYCPQVEALVAQMPREQVDYHLSKLAANPYQPELLAQQIQQMLASLGIVAGDAVQTCLLGHLLAQQERIPFAQSRVIVNSYRKYLS